MLPIIIGAVVGGIVLVAIAAVVVMRKRNSQTRPAQADKSVMHVANPVYLPSAQRDPYLDVAPDDPSQPAVPPRLPPRSIQPAYVVPFEHSTTD